MNEFGRFAQRAWQELAPSAYRELQNPKEHFSDLGRRAQEAWVDLSRELEDPVPADETWVQQVGRLRNAEQRAAEMIREQHCLPPMELREDPQTEPSQTQPQQ